MQKINLVLENKIELQWDSDRDFFHFRVISQDQVSPETAMMLQNKHAQKMWQGYGFYSFSFVKKDDQWITTWKCATSCD